MPSMPCGGQVEARWRSRCQMMDRWRPDRGKLGKCQTATFPTNRYLGRVHLRPKARWKSGGQIEARWGPGGVPETMWRPGGSQVETRWRSRGHVMEGTFMAEGQVEVQRPGRGQMETRLSSGGHVEDRWRPGGGLERRSLTPRVSRNPHF